MKTIKWTCSWFEVGKSILLHQMTTQFPLNSMPLLKKPCYVSFAFILEDGLGNNWCLELCLWSPETRSKLKFD